MKKALLLMTIIMVIISVSCKKGIAIGPKLDNSVPTVFTDSSTNITTYSVVFHGTIKYLQVIVFILL